MKTRAKIGAAAFVVVAFSGCSAGVDGEGTSGDGEGEGAPAVEEDVGTSPAAATACPSVTATVAEHVAMQRATLERVPFLFFTFDFYYATSAKHELIGSDPNQRVTLYAAAIGTTLDAASCTATSNICGDGIAQVNEPCDGTSLGSTTCAGLGYFGGGTPTCTPFCQPDATSCRSACNNGHLEPGEYCDVPGEPVQPWRCDQFAEAYTSGAIKCGSDCHEDLSECVASVCGNGIREAAEQCDGADLGGVGSCQAYSPSQYDAGTLRCTSDCQYDASACLALCGNGVIDGVEQCDGAKRSPEFAGKSCKDLQFPYATWPFATRVNYASGTLGCNSSCSLDLPACKPLPGCYYVPQWRQVQVVCY